MKNKFKKINIILFLVIIILFSNICYGKLNNFILTDEYHFDVGNNFPSNAYVKIFIGDANVATYQTGSVNISPKPSTYEFDDFGNRIAVYNLEGYKSKELDIRVTKNVKTSNFIEPEINNKLKYSVEDIYLEPSNFIESTNPLIIAKAKEVTKGKSTDYEKAKSIFEFVNMYLTYDTSELYKNKGALSALNTKRGVCEEYASLFVALCRASNVPARIITGFRVSDLDIGQEGDSTKIYHAWAEVYLKGYGWLPIEVTAEKLVNNKRVVYWDGFLNLKQPIYVVEGIYNNEISEIRWLGVTLNSYDKQIKLVDAKYFSDISNHWAKKNIEKIYDNEIIKGYEDGTFKPDNNISRIEFLVMLNRLLEKSNSKYLITDNIYYPSDFINNWSKEEYDQLMRYYAYIFSDTQNGAGYKTITNVFGSKLNMDIPITREEVVALLAPFITENNNIQVAFSDIETSKFKNEIIKLAKNNILKGYEDGTFRPNGRITRAEAATIFARSNIFK